MPGQVVWQLPVVILIEYFVLEADLRLQLSDLFLQLSLGSRFVLARPHHSRACSCASSHEVHLLRVSHEKRAEVNIALEVSGVFGLELLALHEDVGMLGIRRLAWHPTLDLLWVRWLVPALQLSELEPVGGIWDLTTLVLRLEERRSAVLARSLRRVADPRASHDLPDDLRLKVIQQSGIRTLGVADQAVEVGLREWHIAHGLPRLLPALHQRGCVTSSLKSGIAVKVQRLGELVVDYFGYSCDALESLSRRSCHLALSEATN